MFRKGLIPLLRENPMGIAEIAHLMDLKPKEVEEDLKHLIKSLKYSEYQLTITAAKCRKCGFIFSQEKLHKPGKCPKCHGTWISEPRFGIREKP
jgi:predicted Zn-ribbon and HTH transcriptional regulator